ncbi:MAG: hypothetical protein AAGG01_03880 [Planctomycetota bacterium]
MKHTANPRWTLYPALLVLGASTSLAFTPQSSPQTLKPTKVPGAIKNAGIYHVSTGQWTRTGDAVSNFGPDTIYNNTTLSGYFTDAGGLGGFAPGSTNFDEGGVPTIDNTGYALADRTSYSVNCVDIGYCDINAGGTGGWNLRFYNSYAPCTLDVSPDVSLEITGLPANGCWFLTLDLSGGNEFCLEGDGGNGFDANPDLDSFGWSFTYAGTQPTAGSQSAGFLLAGDPASTDPSWVIGSLPTDGTETYYGPPSLCGTGATGLITRDQWYLEDPNDVTNSGCYWFGGYRANLSCSPPSTVYTSYFMRIQADVGECTAGIGSPAYCASNPNSTGANSTIRFDGSLSVAADDLLMTATLPANTFGFFITSQTRGFVANPAGSSGNICVAGQIGRFVGPGQVKNSGASGQISLDTAAAEWSLGAIPTSVGPYAAQAGSTAHFQLWHRDVDGAGMPTSNFTNGYALTWAL